MKKLVNLGIIACTVVALTACGSGSSGSGSSKQLTEPEETKSSARMAPKAKTKEKKSAVSYDDLTIETPDYKLVITGFERAKDHDDDECFYLFYDLTNKTDSAESISSMMYDMLNVAQDTGAVTEDLNTAFIYDGPYEELLDIRYKKLNGGQTISGAEAFKFVDSSKNVTLEFFDPETRYDEPIATEELQIP